MVIVKRKWPHPRKSCKLNKRIWKNTGAVTTEGAKGSNKTEKLTEVGSQAAYEEAFLLVCRCDMHFSQGQEITKRPPKGVKLKVTTQYIMCFPERWVGEMGQRLEHLSQK